MPPLSRRRVSAVALFVAEQAAGLGVDGVVQRRVARVGDQDALEDIGGRADLIHVDDQVR